MRNRRAPGGLASLALTVLPLVAAAQSTDQAGREPPESVAEEKGPAVPSALLSLVNREGRVSWKGVAPGMPLRDVSSLLGVQLRTDRPVASGCGGEGLDVVLDGTWVLLAFTGADRSAELHTMLIRAEEGADRETLIAALEEQVGELRYLGGSRRPPREESTDPAPAYAAGDPEVVLVVEPGRGLRITVPLCFD